MEVIKITVENKGKEGKGKLVVYNGFNQEYSFIPNKGEQGDVTTREYKIPPGEQNGDNCLVIAPAPGPGNEVGTFTIDIPVNSGSQIKFTQSGIENMTITPSGENTSLTISPGQPGWQLKITRTSLLAEPRDPVGSGQGSHGGPAVK
jgi:hypothetical protein